MASVGDEAPDPRAELQETAERMAQDLMRTAELAEKLRWADFDFEVDRYDPYLDDLEAFLTSGQATRELISQLIAHCLSRHLTLDVRHKALLETEKRLASEVRLDVRQLGQVAIRGLQHLTLPATSLGLLWQLYPRYVTRRLQERRAEMGRESADRSAAESALADALASGKGDPAELKAMGAKAAGVLEDVLWGWAEKAPENAETAKRLVAMAGEHPGRRAARMLAAVFYTSAGDLLGAEVRAALTKMPREAREIVAHHLTIRDPEARVRRLLYRAAAELKDRRVVPLMAADLTGTGPWSQAGEGTAHVEEILAAMLATGDPRSVPMMLHLIAQRPPKADARQAIESAFAASPFAAAFAEGLKRQKDGRPVTVPRDMGQEEFLQTWGKFAPNMDPAKMQAEIKRVSALWDECWHEALDWRRPAEAMGDAGPRERELLQKLSTETRAALGRLQGHPQVSALESEFKSKWMTTPQNDVSGRIPLAIILDERKARGQDEEENRHEREQESADLYSMACRAKEVGMDEDARRLAGAVLQVLPGHPFAKDFLERLDRGAGIPGIDAGAEAASGPSIILPS